MNTPDPLSCKPGWVPTTSTVGGALIGGTVAQLAIGILQQCGIEPNNNITAGLTTLCVLLAGYFFQDGGRK